MHRWFLLFLLIGALAACGETSSTLTPSATETAQPTPPGVLTPLPGQLGQSIPVPGWTITVTSARTAASSGSSTPNTPGDVFLIVEVRVQNTSALSQRADSTQFTLHSPDGTDFGAPYVGVDLLVEIDGLVASGASVQGQLTYDVPPESHQFILGYEDSDGQEWVQWHLSV